MKKYKLNYDLIDECSENFVIDEFETREEAEMCGFRSIDDIMNDDSVDEERAEEIWREERENWLEYSADEIN